MNSILKTCSKCKQQKPRSEFYKSNQKRDGLYPYCKECKRKGQRQVSRSWYWGKMGGSRPKPNYNQENRLNQQRKRHEDDRDMYRAHDAVNKQIGKGKIKPAREHRCIGCGRQAAHYHHHKGYDKKHWLDVVPLCTACHGKERRID